MDAKQFLAEFGHIANAPGGMQRLRELVLQLAFTGELSTQKPDDLTLDLIESGSLSSNEGLFFIPDNWLWANFDLLTEHIQYGVTAKAVQRTDGVRFLRITDIQGDKVNWKSVPSCDFPEEKQTKFLLKNGDILIARTGGTIGKSYLVEDLDVLSVFASYLIRLTPLPIVDCRYLKLFTLSPSYWHQLSEATAGTGLPNVSASSLKRLEIPLPPIEEQSRIVAKVDELMALCDKLEAQQQKKRKLQNKLRQSVLQAVANAESPKELQDSWERLAGNFSHLFAEAEDVEQFIFILKSLAVRGLLTPESTNRPDIESIVNACTLLREDYISRKLMRKQKAVSIAAVSISYPENWSILAFDDIAIVIGGVTKGRNLKDREKIICPYLSVANVQRGYFELGGLKSIEIAKEELEKYQVHDGDILITEGGDWDKVGRTAIWQEKIEPCLHQNHVFKARIPSDLVANDWVEFVFNSSIGRDYFAGASKQTTNLASINMTQLRSFPFPIPPLEQQEAILKELKTLVTSCESLREKHKRKQKTAERLATAAIASLTGISTPQQEEPMKVPKTELKAPVRLGTAQPPSNMQAPLASLLARHNGEMGANDLWQRFGGEIDAFYAQLKTEVMHGWIAEPTGAQILEKEAD